MTDPRNFYFNSNYDIDKIIGVFANTVTISAPSISPGFIMVTDTHAHGFEDSTYFQGIFTTDGGITYNDFGAQTPNLAAPAPQFQTLDVEAMVDGVNANIYMTNYYDSAHSSSQTYTVTYKIYLLAKNVMAFPITPLVSNDLLYFDSNFNYQKIALESAVGFTVSAGSIGSSVVAHNLGYIPKVRAFFFPGTNQAFAMNQTVVPTAAQQIEVRIDTVNVTFYSDQSGFSGTTINGIIEFRVYYDD